jgi:hypothetical protein
MGRLPPSFSKIDDDGNAISNKLWLMEVYSLVWWFSRRLLFWRFDTLKCALNGIGSYSMVSRLSFGYGPVVSLIFYWIYGIENSVWLANIGFSIWDSFWLVLVLLNYGIFTLLLCKICEDP